jgi:hypothetical protein
MAPVLQLPDFDRDFIMECDVSGHGLGAVLHQGSGPVAFFSRQMAQRHSKLVAYKRELIALVQAVKHWRPYLWGGPFVIRTDHYSLKFLLDQRLATLPQHQWASKLIGFDFKVEFKPGTTNVVTDTLSRRDTEETTTVAALSIPSFHLFGDLRRELDTDLALRVLKEEAAAGARGASWAVVDDLITVDGRVYVPTSSASLQAILDNEHGAGHEGTEKTLHRVRADFHIPSTRALVHEFMRACAICQRNKSDHLHPAGLLQPLEVPSPIWSDIALDFIEGFLRVNGKMVTLTVVDRFSKYAHFMPLGHLYTATTVARAFFDNIVRLYGMPTSVVSDREPVFTCHFWKEKELFKLSGVQL